MTALAFLAKWVVARLWHVRECPRCGGHLVDGFGLAGGGFGPYRLCESCPFFVKRRSPT